MFERNGLQNLKVALSFLEEKGCINRQNENYFFNNGHIELCGEEVTFCLEFVVLPMLGGQIAVIEGISDKEIAISFRTSTGDYGFIHLEVKIANQAIQSFYVGDDGEE